MVVVVVVVVVVVGTGGNKLQQDGGDGGGGADSSRREGVIVAHQQVTAHMCQSPAQHSQVTPNTVNSHPTQGSGQGLCSKHTTHLLHLLICCSASLRTELSPAKHMSLLSDKQLPHCHCMTQTHSKHHPWHTTADSAAAHLRYTLKRNFSSSRYVPFEMSRNVFEAMLLSKRPTSPEASASLVVVDGEGREGQSWAGSTCAREKEGGGACAQTGGRERTDSGGAGGLAAMQGAV